MNRYDPASLEAAYRRARYCVQLAGSEFVLRAGRRHRHADTALLAAGVRSHWAIATPCNPGSRRLAESENAGRLDRFRTDLTRRGWLWIPAVNRDPDGHWPDEPGALLADVERDGLLAFVRPYGQAAILLGRIGHESSIYFL